MIGTIFSEDGTYRYSLERTLNAGADRRLVGTAAFIMLNPSTATETEDDPTIRRCKGFAEAWGFKHLLVGNLFGYRATDPKELHSAEDPVGPYNDRYLELIGGHADLVVCAWGAHKLAAPRAREASLPAELTALKVTASGQPGHPLYLPKNLAPRRFEVPA